jgi:hypothetical protein
MFSLLRQEKHVVYAFDEKVLVISHKDPQEVFCTIQLQPPRGGWDSTFPIGILDVILYYHTTQGDRGRLYLRSPSSFGGDYLARLLKTDVEVEGAIITPKGLQRGNDDHDESQERVLVYKSLTSSFNTFFRSLSESRTWLPGSIPTPTLPSERVVLNQAIEKMNALPSILERLNILSDILGRLDTEHLDDIYDHLNAVHELAIDLCTGLLLPECTEALVRLGLAGPLVGLPQEPTLYEELSLPLTTFWSLADRIVYALSIRHLLKPSDALANFILALWEQHRAGKTGFLHFMKEVPFIALSLFRQGRWAEALKCMLTTVKLKGEAM